VRYAETCGHEYDPDLPDAYRYRDYVIRAFNDDLPYDRFVAEHIAGDLLPDPRRHPTEGINESILGTGFWFLGESKHSPVDVRADQADRIDNQIDVFSKAFLGLTVSCARCHDHKFDAVSTRDYYALAGYLESSRLRRAAIDPPGGTRDLIDRLRALQGRVRSIAVPATADALAEQAGDLPSAWRGLAGPGADLSPDAFTTRRQELVRQLKAQAARAAEQEARCTLFADFRKDGFRDWFVTGEAFGSGPSTADDLVAQPRPGRLVRRLVGPGQAHSGLVSDRLQGELRSRTFTISRKKIHYHAAGRACRINLIVDGYQHIRDPIYGGLAVPLDHGDRLRWYVQDVSMWQGHRAYVEVLDEGDGLAAVDGILFADDGPPAEAPNGLLLRLLDDPGLTSPAALARKFRGLAREIVGQWREDTLGRAPDAADRVAVLNELLEAEPTASAAARQRADADTVAALLREQRDVEARIASPRRALAMADGTGVNERVFIRGNHKTLGDEVPRRFLEALAGADQPAPVRGSGRLDLARRMTDPPDPLLPRVLVNRLWQHHFGEGIVRSVDNFGVLGERPTHPELLDWLAAEFVRRGWSVKAMHRLLVRSSTYRMASRGDSGADERDPQNLLLHRMPIRRLEAECIRDALLAVSGRLDRRTYGRSVPPYVTDFMVGRGRPASGPLDGDGRRSIYLNVRRNFLTPLFLAFDYPVPFTTMGRRTVSNVPAQALALLNNPFVLQQAERWAQRALAEPGRTPRRRVTGLYVEAFGRPPSAGELDDALDFLNEQGRQYGRADDPRAWMDLCHVLINVKEFIFLD
jgi:hypothetical protein